MMQELVNSQTIIVVFLEIVLKLSIVLAGCFLLHTLLKKFAPFAGSRLWLTVFMLLLFMPLLIYLLPEIHLNLTRYDWLQMPHPAATGATTHPAGLEPANFPDETYITAGRSAEPGSASRWKPAGIPFMLISIWAVGFLLAMLRITSQLISTKRFISGLGPPGQNTVLVPDISVITETVKKYRITIYLSKDVSAPITCGIVNPVIVLPLEYRTWPELKRISVLLHELAHISHRDILSRLIALIVIALYWFHPFIWIAYSRLKEGQEYLADGFVLENGVKATDYADCLMEFVQTTSMMEHNKNEVFAHIGNRSSMRDRISSLLSHQTVRRNTGRNRTVIVTLVMFLTMMPVASLSLSPAPPGASAPGEFLNDTALPTGRIFIDYEFRHASRTPVAQLVGKLLTADNVNKVDTLLTAAIEKNDTILTKSILYPLLKYGTPVQVERIISDSTELELAIKTNNTLIFRDILLVIGAQKNTGLVDTLFADGHVLEQAVDKGNSLILHYSLYAIKNWSSEKLTGAIP